MTPYTRSGVGVSAAGVRMNHALAALPRAPRSAERIPGSVRLQVRRDFAAARMSRLEGDWLTGSQSGPIDQQIRWQAQIIRQRARDLALNTPMGRHYRRLLTANVLGHAGIRMQARNLIGSDDAELITLDSVNNRKIERAWRRWGKSPVTVDGKLDWLGFQQLALKTVATDGECFVRIWRNWDGPDRIALQFIDADLINEQHNRQAGTEGPEIRMGIEIDSFGKPTAYYVNRSKSQYYFGNTIDADPVRIPADEILHLFVLERPNQTRGISWFVPVALRAKMLDSYAEAELVGARVGASKMGFIQAKDGASVSVPEPGAGDEPKAPVIMEGNPGTIEQLDPGWEFNAWDPTHPTTSFAPFVKAISRDLWSGLGVSYNAGANDLEGVNFSSMRSGLLNERDFWKELQQWWIFVCVRPIGAREWLNTALLSGSIDLPTRVWTDWAEIEWIPRGWPWVDPSKDVQASSQAIDAGLSSRSRVLSEQGEDFEETLHQLAAESQLAKKLGVELVSAKAPAPPPPGDNTDNPDAPPAKEEDPAE